MSLYFQRTEGFPHPFATTPREKLFSMLCCIWYGGSGQLHLPTRRVVEVMIADKILKQTFQFNLDSPLKFGRFVLWTYRRIPTSVCDDTNREVVLRVLLHTVGGVRTAAFASTQSCERNDSNKISKQTLLFNLEPLWVSIQVWKFNFDPTEGFPHPFASAPTEKLFSVFFCIVYGGSGQLHLRQRRNHFFDLSLYTYEFCNLDCTRLSLLNSTRSKKARDVKQRRRCTDTAV